MKVTYSSFAANELEAAANYFESKRPGLREAFLVDFQATLERVRQAPQRFVLLECGLRRASLKRFPYHILFRESGNQLRILIVRHHSRHPDYGLDCI